MAEIGQVLENLKTGDTYEFLETNKSTQGERTTVKMTLKNKAKLVPDHIHSVQDEYFEVLSGELTILFDGKKQILGKGDKIILPKNKAHNHYNGSDNELVFTHTVSPALDFEYLLETMIGLERDGKTRNGKMGLMQELVILKYIEGKSYLASIPIWLQKILMNTVGPIGRLFGYKAIYIKYSGIEK